MLPVYELTISEDIKDNAEVSFVALVDSPAIKKDFLAFKEDFIQPSKGEHETEFIPRCISYVVGEGKDSEQATAICYSIWEQHFAESYNDYPKEATENAKIALRWAEQNGWGDCGTPVGKIRANQLANGEGISRDTIARMSAFERHRQNSQKELGDGCGRLMWLAWGGDAGIEWASRKLEQIDKEGMAGGISFDFDGVLTTSRGIKKLEEAVNRGTNVYIISARQDDKGLKEFASKHGVKLDNVYATGSNKAKVEKIKQLGLSKHYDNNEDVIKELGSIGEKFLVYQFAISNEDKHIISGPLMIPNELIYRNNERFGEHYVKFSPETIKQIAIKLSKKGYQNNVNLMHDSNQVVDGVTMFEMFISDSERGVMPMKGFEDLPDGTLFGSYFVENKDVWDGIKNGTYKGFSVEGLFDYVEPMSKDDILLQKIQSLLNEIIED